MNAFILCMSLVLMFAFVSVVFSMLIVRELQKRKVKINFFFLKLYLPKYAHQYKEITLKETGKVGPLFFGWLVSINAAWVFAILGLVLRGTFAFMATRPFWRLKNVELVRSRLAPNECHKTGGGK